MVANINDAEKILHGLYDRFANNIAEKLHVQILLCVEAIPPAPSQVAAEQHEVCDSHHSNVAILTPFKI